MMELLIHLFYFLLCSALIVIAWFVFLFFNNLIDNLKKGIIQGFLGSVNAIVLLTGIGIIAYYFAFSFFTGVLFAMILIFLVYAGKKALADLIAVKG